MSCFVFLNFCFLIVWYIFKQLSRFSKSSERIKFQKFALGDQSLLPIEGMTIFEGFEEQVNRPAEYSLREKATPVKNQGHYYFCVLSSDSDWWESRKNEEMDYSSWKTWLMVIAGSCGSCWAFATVASVETANVLAGNALVALSEQVR